MNPLYITSVVTFSGKTALCLGLGLYLQRQGLNVCYMKPVSTQGSNEGERARDADATFVSRVIRSKHPIETITPVIVNDELLERQMTNQLDRDLWNDIQTAYDQVSQGADVVLLEGGSSMQDGFAVGLNSVAVARQLGTPALVISRWRGSAYLLDDIMAAKHRLKDNLKGVILNAIPASHWDHVAETMVPYLEREGIPVYAVLPYRSPLMAISIGELADLLDAKYLVGEHLKDRLIENTMVGAMTVETALPSLHGAKNKAVITGGDRHDLQAAALETSTLCLILTGGIEPGETVMQRATDMGVAILMVEHTTIEVVEQIERQAGKSRLRQAEKLNRFQALLQEHFDYDRFLADFGIEIS